MYRVQPRNVCIFQSCLSCLTCCLFLFNFLFFCICQKQPDNTFGYGRPATVTTYDNKQYFQTSIASAQRAPTENYYQTSKCVTSHFSLKKTFLESYTVALERHTLFKFLKTAPVSQRCVFFPSCSSVTQRPHGQFI